MIAIIDYDAGNIKSVEKAVLYLGGEPLLTRKPEEILAADKIILPGVGAFGDAMEKLQKYGLVEVIKEAVRRQIPFLGICLGMQLLFASSEESPGVEGLSLLPGKIVKIPAGEGLKIPHIGWNSLSFEKECGRKKGVLFQGLEEDAFVYFVHSFYLKAGEAEIVKATTEYGVTIHASVEKENVFGCQFHPEKSSEVGLAILKNFMEYKG